MSKPPFSHFVVLDLETTSIDKDLARIIDFTAIKFEAVSGQEVDRLSLLVNPEIVISKEIIAVTKITNEMVSDAPVLSEIKDKIKQFVGFWPIVGHNIGFDLDILSSNGFDFSQNQHIDTWILSASIEPTLPGFNLDFLARYFRLVHQPEHRAEADVLATRDLLLVLVQKMAGLKATTKEQTRFILEKTNWKGRPGFLGFLELTDFYEKSELISSLAEAAVKESKVASKHKQKFIKIKNSQLKVDKFFGQDGFMAKNFKEHFEYRPSQAEMSKIVLSCLKKSTNAFIEAGTGLGKSLAYLFSSLVFAKSAREKVVVATKTINLQEQLFNKELPQLKSLLNFKFKVSLLFGRSNYLCQAKLSALRDRKRFSRAEAPVWLKALAWLESTKTGYLGELNLRFDEEEVKRVLIAESEFCRGKKCPEYKQCWFYQARRKARSADIVITNQATVLESCQLAEPFLEFSHLIIDEAHNLEDTASQSLALKIKAADFGRPLAKLLSLKVRPDKDINNDLKETIESAKGLVKDIFKTLNDYLPKEPFAKLDLVQVKNQPNWPEIEIKSQNLIASLEIIIDQLADYCARQPKSKLILFMIEQVNYLTKLSGDFNNLLLSSRPDTVNWLDLSDQGEAVLNQAPVSVAEFISRQLAGSLKSLILTSATLTTVVNFNYLKSRLGLWDDFSEHILVSPFDYNKQALILIPQDIALPKDENIFLQQASEIITAASSALGGKTLVFFTSRASLKIAYELCFDRLFDQGITLLAQGISGGRQKILAKFKDKLEKTVLFGTNSFWEGVDVKGDQLSCLVVTKLPFDVPTDPLFMARSRLYNNSFKDYSLPRAILRLKQGFGRLIRSSSDRGICIFLDKRLAVMEYGQLCLSSLPPAKTEIIKIKETENKVKNFLSVDNLTAK